jgi:hypothetical protein
VLRKPDIFKSYRQLIAAGVDRKQAEAHARAVRDTLAPQLVTKADLDAAVARIEAKMAELEARMLRYMVAQTAVFAGIVFALQRLVK